MCKKETSCLYIYCIAPKNCKQNNSQNFNIIFSNHNSNHLAIIATRILPITCFTFASLMGTHFDECNFPPDDEQTLFRVKHRSMFCNKKDNSIFEIQH